MSPPGFVVPEATRLGQRRAADPASSAWVSANAGAGKTKVLTDRVIRLLLAGTAPSRILCLTFTKAAAANMTIRVFGELGRWVTLDDVALTDTLRGLTGEAPSRALLADARRLFARSVETPGGLKIETIHAFCERVLHLVPFEANVPARFAVLDDSQVGEILAGARADILTRAARGGAENRDIAEALEVVAAQLAGDGLLRLIDGAALDESIPGDEGGRRRAVARLARALGLDPGETVADTRRAMLEDGIPPAERTAIAAELRRTGSANDAKRASALDAALSAGSLDGRVRAYLDLFFNTAGEPRDKDLVTRKVDPGIRAALVAEQARLDPLRERLRAAETLERSAALYRLAGAVRERAEAHKARLGALDFSDLIRRTLALLERDSAAWVLYRLDRGIDHVLVDEAQDTNPAQWEILKHLTEEFTSGAGRAARTPRTLFAVGDPKQSIYSFQGADPRWFEQSRRHWRDRSRVAELPFADVRLDLSFRSAKTVLDAVDHTFRVGAHYRGLSFDDDALGTSHETARPTAPGHVEIWPTETRGDATPDPDAWSIPLDLPERAAPAIALANKIALAAKHWTSVPDPVTGRIFRPGEILVLVRRRGPVFFAVIRALKKAGVPVAGADRFDIGEHIAVNDLVAAGGAALLPDNDLVLAAALKSPLVGLDDDDLIAIAADRGAARSVFDALSERAAAGDDRAAAAFAAVTRWRDLARRHGPFGFYAALLGPEGGRRRLVERLGLEAADAIDAFLIYAQTSEIGPDAPSLTGFLARFDSAAHTIKRDLDSAGDDVKVMTVHGAKGLEAPLVVVVDGSEVYGPEPALVGLDTGEGVTLPVWAPGAKSDCRAVAFARQASRDLRLEEHNRLLYVAMTRAKDRLVVAPYAGNRSDPPEAWSAMIRRGFAEATQALTLTETPYGEAEIWAQHPPGGETGRPDARGGPTAPEAAPDWLTRPVSPEPDALPPLTPSGALTAADRPAPSRRPRAAEPGEARRRGVLIHALLEHLGDVPEDERAESARVFLAARAPRLDEERRQASVAEVLAVLRHPALARLFGPGSRAEAPLSGIVATRRFGERGVVGQVDRLVVAPDEILIADFKTGGRVPGEPVPDAYRAQLGLYAALLAQVHPGRPVRAFVVWTADLVVDEIDTTALAAALDLDAA